jgi:putative ABC transport system permease protein
LNLAVLSLAYLRARALNTALNLILLALGIATIVVLILFGAQLADRLTRDARGFDLVVGAKGSPMQLILSAIYHVDVPTGNVPAAAAEELRANPMVRAVIQLALGDSLRGFRIVGTEHAYADHYGARPADGRLWAEPFEATLGARVAGATGLGIGDRFVGSHGLGPGGPAHGDHSYEVVGILGPTGTVIDRLILTPIESVWLVHDAHPRERPAGGPFMRPGVAPTDAQWPEHDREEDDHDPGEEATVSADGAHAHGDEPEPEEGREVTALLVQYGTPLAAVSLPRLINSQSALQAASPAFETTRLLALVGVGLDTLRVFGGLLIAAAALGVFIALTNALQERRYDLAVMRALGATRGTLFRQMLLEGSILVGAGTALGVATGHIVTELLGRAVPEARLMGLTGLVVEPGELYVLALAVVVGLTAAAIPAARAYRTDIAGTLAARG